MTEFAKYYDLSVYLANAVKYGDIFFAPHSSVIDIVITTAAATTNYYCHYVHTITTTTIIMIERNADYMIIAFSVQIQMKFYRFQVQNLTIERVAADENITRLRKSTLLLYQNGVKMFN